MTRKLIITKPKIKHFMTKINKVDSGCWEWTGYVKPNGYGQFAQPGSQIVYAHRWIYAAIKGEIPEGYDIDHLCRNRKCVNPDHLEAVTRLENLKRSPIYRGNVKSAMTHCPSGHPYDESNTYNVPGRSHRLCRKCRYERNKLASKRRQHEQAKQAA